MKRILTLVIVLATLIVFTLFNNTLDGFMDAGRCGVGLPSCDERVRCMNGYCKSDNIQHIPELSDLELIPSRR